MVTFQGGIRGPNGYTYPIGSMVMVNFPTLIPQKSTKIHGSVNTNRPLDPFDFRIDVLIETWIGKYSLAFPWESVMGTS